MHIIGANLAVRGASMAKTISSREARANWRELLDEIQADRMHFWKRPFTFSTPFRKPTIRLSKLFPSRPCTPPSGRGCSKPATRAMRWRIAKRFMRERVAIDTFVLVGILNSGDHWHETAVRLFARLKAEGNIELVVFDCVVAESVSVIYRRLEEKRRLAEVAAFLEKIEAHFPSDVITWILPQTPRYYLDVIALIRQTNGRLNFNDALIALLCQTSSIYQITSFDTNFDLVPWVRRIHAWQQRG